MPRHNITAKNRRKPGEFWRILCWRRRPSDLGDKIELSSEDHPGAGFDEVVVDDWLHVEQMNDDQWWVRLGERVFWVHVSRNKTVPSKVTEET